MNKPRRIDNEDLREIRRHVDWQRLFEALGIEKDEKKSKPHDWWGKSPFKPEESTASFHIRDDGRWYCFSTSQGGGPIELVQLLKGGNCYEAARWLLENGVSSLVKGTQKRVASVMVAKATGASDTERGEERNKPIRQDLTKSSYLSPVHPEFDQREISAEILEELGIGYLERPDRTDGKPDYLNRRFVFQVRGVEERNGRFEPVVLSHIGRASSDEQAEQDGKWWGFPGFRRSLSVYNIDRMILDDEAIDQGLACGHIIVVESCFSVAKLYAAGIRNVVGTFGSAFSPQQARQLDLISEMTGVDRFVFWYDRDTAGRTGAVKAARKVEGVGLDAGIFDWGMTFSNGQRQGVPIAAERNDPCDFSIDELRWLRDSGGLYLDRGELLDRHVLV